MAMISVIVSVYNTKDYLCECIDSILQQVFTDFELLLVDDGSTDGSGIICDDYANKDKRIRVIHQDNRGQATARNRAINIARGEWLCFIDSDDAVSPFLLSHLYQAATESDSHMSMCQHYEAGELPNDFFLSDKFSYLSDAVTEDKLIEYYYSKEYYFTVWAKLIKKEVVQQCLFPEGLFYEDEAVICQWIYFSQKVALVHQKLYFYRVNPNGTTKSPFSTKQFDSIYALQIQLDFLKSIHFLRIWNVVVKEYRNYVLDYYRIAKNEFPNTAYAENIKKNALVFIEENKRLFSGPNVYECFFESLAPNRYLLMRIKRKIKKVLHISK